MYTDKTTLEEDQRIFVYFFLWLLHEGVHNEPVDKERLSKAFGFTVIAAHAYNVDLEFKITNGTDAFPAFESILDDTFSKGFIKSVAGENSFVFSDTADEGFKRFFPASTAPETTRMRNLTLEACRLGIRAYFKGADAVQAIHSILPSKDKQRRFT